MLKRSLRFLAVLLILIGIVLLAIPMFFQKQVESAFIKRVNSYVTTELIIKDKIELSLFRNFPYASLTLHSVELRENIPNSRRNLLEVEHLSFLFSWWDIFRGRYMVEQISMKNGNLHLRRFNDGTSNYQVFETKTDADDEEVALQLKQVILNGIEINYLDENYYHETLFNITNGTMSGNFGSLRYNMLLNADLQVKQFYIYNTNYLPDKSAKLDLNIGIDFADNTYTFGKSNLDISGNKFDLSGKIGFAGNTTDVNLDINGINLNLSDIKDLLPNAYIPRLKDMTSTGTLQVSAKVKGIYSKFEQPSVDINFNLDKGTLTHPDLNGTLRNLQVNGSFTNGFQKQLSTSELVIENLSFVLNGKNMSASAKVKDFDNPVTHLKLDGTLELPTLGESAKAYHIDKLAGQITFNQVLLDGKLNDLYNATALVYPTLTGGVNASNIYFHYNNKEVQNLGFQVNFNGQHVQLEGLQLTAGNSDMALNGQIYNFTPLMFQAMAKDTIQLSQPVNLNLTVQSKLIDLADLMNYINNNEVASENPPKQTEAVVNKQHYAVGNIEMTIDKLIRNNLDINNIKGKVTFDDSDFTIQQITMQMMGGQAEMRGNFAVDDNRHVNVKTFFSCTGLDMNQLLTETGNFGQTTFTDKNIKGVLNGKAYLTVPLDNKLKLDEQAFKLIADVSIENGELIDFEPMMSLSKFVKLSELNRVKFARLENQIEISNRKIRIPAMYIHSNAVKLTFSGIHSFDNRLYYYVKLNLLDLLTNKFRKQNNNIATESNPKGGVNLFLTMSGRADKTDIQYMKRKQVKNQFEKDNKRQKTDLQKILEQEFSFESTAPADSMDIDMLMWQDTTNLKLK